jgi:hypothetical protein
MHEHVAGPHPESADPRRSRRCRHPGSGAARGHVPSSGTSQPAISHGDTVQLGDGPGAALAHDGRGHRGHRATGVLLSVGSATTMPNIVAGYMILYRRCFRIGDRVKIGDIYGDVIDVRLKVTHVRTIRNEEITRFPTRRFSPATC